MSDLRGNLRIQGQKVSLCHGWVKSFTENGHFKSFLGKILIFAVKKLVLAQFLPFLDHFRKIDSKLLCIYQDGSTTK